MLLHDELMERQIDRIESVNPDNFIVGSNGRVESVIAHGPEFHRNGEWIQRATVDGVDEVFLTGSPVEALRWATAKGLKH